MYRNDGSQSVIVGVNAYYSFPLNDDISVTNWHTRLDVNARFGIGQWLRDRGVETVAGTADTAAGDSSDPAGLANCDDAASCDACVTCELDRSCEPEWHDCQEDQDCLSLIECLNGCSDESCRQGSSPGLGGARFPSGRAERPTELVPRDAPWSVRCRNVRRPA